MKLYRRLCLSALCLICLLFCAVCLAEEAPAVRISGAYDYIVLPDGTAQICGYRGKHSQIDLPSKINGFTVSSIGSSAFIWQTELTSITIPDTVTQIDDRAFGWCIGLTEITIPDSVTSMGENPFIGCEQLTDIILSDQHPAFETIDGVLFDKQEKRLISYPCAFSAASYEIPSDTISIGGYAFFGCNSLINIDIPSSVISLGPNPFCDCRNLTDIAVAPDHMTLIVINNALFETANFNLISYPCSSDAAYYQIPQITRSIGQDAFYNCTALTEIVIPSSVTAIGTSAFFGCTSLASVTLPNSVTSLGGSAFARCTSLTRAILPGSIESIGENPFRECSALSTISVSSNHPLLATIDGVLFNKAEKRLVCYPVAFSSQTYIIPQGIESIGANAFSGCTALTNVSIPATVTDIQENAFSNCPGLALTVVRDSQAARYAQERRINHIYANSTDWLNN